MLRGTAQAVARARRLRRSLTLPEGLLWRELRKRRAGPRFRKQHPAGPFVLHFACLRARLAIEIDGEAHDRSNRPARDEARDLWLANQGYRTLRIPAREVLADVGAVVAHILDHCHPHSSPARGGGPPAQPVVEGPRQTRCQPLHHPASRGGPPPHSGEERPLHQPPPAAPAGPPPRSGEELP